MEMIRRLEPLALLFMIVGALNWGIVGLFDTNVVAELFGSGTASDVVYVLVGIAALMLLPRLAESMHVGDRTHPRGV